MFGPGFKPWCKRCNDIDRRNNKEKKTREQKIERENFGCPNQYMRTQIAFCLRPGPEFAPWCKLCNDIDRRNKEEEKKKNLPPKVKKRTTLFRHNLCKQCGLYMGSVLSEDDRSFEDIRCKQKICLLCFHKSIKSCDDTLEDVKYMLEEEMEEFGATSGLRACQYDPTLDRGRTLHRNFRC